MIAWVNSTQFEFEQEGIIYLFDFEKRIAKVIDYIIEIINGDIIIPRSIVYKSAEYIVICISENAFKNSDVQSVQFPTDSQIQTIEIRAFFESQIQSLTIPESLTELKDGWCKGSSNLTEIYISPNNPIYKLYENDMIIGKSSKEADNYDDLVFCSRNAKAVKLPEFIKQIKVSSFEECCELDILEIPINSQLQRIQKNAFYQSSISSLSLPSSLIELENGWCSFTSNLYEINLYPGNPLFICNNDGLLLGKSSIESNNYDELYFCPRWTSKETITIPSYIKKIKANAFQECIITHLIFQPNSELQIIECKAFHNSCLTNFIVPDSVTKICKKAFSCEVNMIEISPNSKLHTIEKSAFNSSKIESFTIPQNLIDLQNGCFSECNLKRIIVCPKNPRYSLFNDKLLIGKSSIELENYDELLNALCDIKKVAIPSFIKKILPFAFYSHKNARIVKFLENSQLQFIGEKAFCYSGIISFTIPKTLKKIDKYAFANCFCLKRFDIPTDSNLDTICRGAFSSTNIKSMFIPAHVKCIEEYAFDKCSFLQIIGFDEKSEMTCINNIIFDGQSQTIIMIPSNLKLVIK